MAYRSGMAVADKGSIITKARPIRIPAGIDPSDFPSTMRTRMHDLERRRDDRAFP